MGCSVPSQRRNISLLANTSLFTYPRMITLDLKAFNKDSETCTFEVTNPTVCVSKEININNTLCQLSYCILPGLDPHSDIIKVCQDACIYLLEDNSLLLSLFDGHGKNGEIVVDFCTKEISCLFANVRDKHLVNDIQGNPLVLLQELASKCEDNLSESQIDISSSGW